MFSPVCFHVWLATSIISFDWNKAKCGCSNQNIYSQKNHAFKEKCGVPGEGVNTFNTRIKHFVLSHHKNVNCLFGSSLKTSLRSYVCSARRTESNIKALKACEVFSVKHHIFLFVALYTFCIQCSIHQFHWMLAIVYLCLFERSDFKDFVIMKRQWAKLSFSPLIALEC